MRNFLNSFIQGIVITFILIMLAICVYLLITTLIGNVLAALITTATVIDYADKSTYQLAGVQMPRNIEVLAPVLLVLGVSTIGYVAVV